MPLVQVELKCSASSLAFYEAHGLVADSIFEVIEGE
jgi:hypothetical protein